jgi:hypothetical protein
MGGFFKGNIGIKYKNIMKLFGYIKDVKGEL